MARLGRHVVGVSVRECARQLGISDTAIHKARKANRLAGAVHADGSVDVEAVRRCMSETADPTRGGQRQAGQLGIVQTAATVGGAPNADDQPLRPQEDSSSLLFAKTKTENIRAIRDQLALDKELGRVAELAPMTRAMVDAMTTAKGELLALPDRLTPLVTPETNTAKVFDLIEAEVKKICEGLQDKLARMADSLATV